MPAGPEPMTATRLPRLGLGLERQRRLDAVLLRRQDLSPA